MCIVSDKVKFCTCQDTDLDEQPNTWRLYRYHPDKSLIVMGSLAYPAYLDEPEYIPNIITFLKRLNESDAFDIPMDFQEEDRIEITIETRIGDRTGNAYFCFKYHNGGWAEKDYDPFDLESRFEEVGQGKLKSLD